MICFRFNDQHYIPNGQEYAAHVTPFVDIGFLVKPETPPHTSKIEIKLTGFPADSVYEYIVDESAGVGSIIEKMVKSLRIEVARYSHLAGYNIGGIGPSSIRISHPGSAIISVKISAA